ATRLLAGSILAGYIVVLVDLKGAPRLLSRSLTTDGFLLKSMFENIAKPLYSLLDQRWTCIGKVQAKGVVPGVSNVKIDPGDKGHFMRQGCREHLLCIKMRRQVHH